MTRRMDRVNVLLRDEISQVLATELRDPRLTAMVSVLRVETSGDLRHAKVFVSVLGDQAQKTSTLAALKSGAGFIHRNLRDQVKLRAVPSLAFYIDDSIERAAEVLELIKEQTPPSEDCGANT